MLWALLFSGGGDGWNGAARHGAITLIACPIVALSLTGKTFGHFLLALIALFIGIHADMNLTHSIQGDYINFQRVSWFAIPWLVLMVAWQVLAIYTIIISILTARKEFKMQESIHSNDS